MFSVYLFQTAAQGRGKRVPMTPRQAAGDWKDLAEKASKEKDPAKLRALIQELIYSLAQEQRYYKDEIESRLDHHFRAMQSAPDPSGGS